MLQDNRRGIPRLTAHPGLRRLVVTAASWLVAAAALSVTPPAAHADARASGSGPLPPPVRHAERHGGDHLIVTVRNVGGGADGTYELYCRPVGGSHPRPGAACAAVERNTRWGQDAFAPVPQDRVCTMQYGGPATARVTGTWAGRPVEATFDRSDGCQIARWDRFVPLLPGQRPHGRP